MSRLPSTRRLGLLAGTALIAASVSGAAFAYDECAPANPPTTMTDGAGGASDPSLNGGTADSFACSATTYATGITYTPQGALTVTKTGSAVTTVTANGVNLTGAGGANPINWDSTAGGVTGGAGTAGPVIHVTSGSGAIGIATAAVTGTQAGTTHAIQAVSDGGGSITVTRTAGNVTNSVAGGQAAIAATTNGGAINISNAAGNTTGRLRGILAETSGAGSVTLSLVGTVSVSNVDGVAAIDVTAGTGGAAITIGGSVQAEAAGALALDVTSAGGLTVGNAGTIGRLNFGITPIGGRIDFSGVTGGGVSFSNTGATASTGRWITTGANVFSAGADLLSMTGVGENWLGANASIDFGAGADTFTMNAILITNVGSLAFGAGADTFNMGGTLALDRVTISGLETFNNAGLILMGPVTSGSNLTPGFGASDRLADDVLTLPGVAFTGSGASRIVMDVLLGGEQAGCGAITAADCLDLRGGSTAGVTTLTVNYVGPDAQQGALAPITLVDVGGGASAATHFVLDPNSEGYVVDTTFGGVLERPGLFRYGLRYDPDTQRHVLIGLPRSEIMEYAVLSGAAQSVWRMTAETVTDRQTDLRAGTEGGSLWMRAASEYSKRDVSTGFSLYGAGAAFDNSYKLYAGTIMGGIDLIVGESGDYDYVLGGQLGYVSSSLELQASPSRGRFTGSTGGVYASVWSDGLFLDATLNANVLTLDYSSPGLTAQTNTYLNAIGGNVEGGLRLPITGSVFVEPLASLAYVRTSFEAISLTGGEIVPADAESLRGALGLRFGAAVTGQVVNASYFVTGRAWNEFEGESGGVVANAGADLPYGDDFSGSFGEAEAGVSLYNTANTLSGFLTSGVKFRDGYSAVNLALGARMAW